MDDVLEPYCGDPRLQIKQPTEKQYKAGGRPVSACEIDVKDLAHYWADDASVRKALHIREVRGDHDMLFPHHSTEAWVKELNYSVTDQWRSWKLHGQIAGYTESYSNKMTYATLKGAGHTAPTK
ncbi:peptidase S10, serine carboxypeptidase, Alpha/Beta hydrolase fold protein [Artemisia annua]|uniref:Peptidase S10, serine carboxypeptidase, Alpha/Beta hydrolase fold protein n=1 Tax=Artemisia annua TaxID=35608 RepID=A0A2U1LQJ7_ARTAN|nr:peptidase S10, serine carboxypeptidase, Alpha/Beta hydrolase fold protein [Artemisia annua]